MAVGLVVLYHVGLLRGGFVGVDVFFVVSGFVITNLLRRRLGESGTISLTTFYLRRVRRLFPALAVMISSTLLLSAFLAPVNTQRAAASTGVAAALAVANHELIRIGGGDSYFGFAADANPLLHTWSLAVEEQFYLVFPLVTLLTWRWATRRGRRCEPVLAGVLLAGASLSFALGVLLTFKSLTLPVLGRLTAYYPAATRAWEFVAGAIVALLGVRELQGSARSAARWLAPAGLGLIAGSAVLLDAGTAFPGVAVLLPVGGTVAVVAGGSLLPTVWTTRVLSASPLQHLGGLSYSWYLWHWPAIVFAGASWPEARYAKVLAAACSLGPAWLSLRIVENPIRSRSQMSARRTVALGLTCVMVPIATSLVLRSANAYLERSYAKPFAQHVSHLAGCEGLPPGSDTASRCRWSVDEPRGTVVLLGDSHAGQFSEGFIAAANASGFDAVVAVRSACLVVGIPVWRHGTEDLGCRRFVDEAIDYLERTRPARVILAASPLYLTAPEFEMQAAADGPRTSDETQKQQIYATGLETLIDELGRVGVPVTVINPIPLLDRWSPLKMPWVRLARAEDSLASRTEKPTALAKRRSMLSAQQQVASTTGAATVDFFELLCPTSPCRAFDGTDWVYRDGSHISVGASQRLTPEFEKILAATPDRRG